MLRIPCPWCGLRDEVEFRYRGAMLARPAAAAGIEAFTRFVYARANPAGWHTEWWLHVAGCRRLLIVRRHTLTHAIESARDALDAPAEPAP
ncbi:MAG: sarcosine oxidase subunit delta [Gammaproteobacteria bacterium]|nr:sarcosine oxidase subunit delta [Gammaproteobacteria bacterium]